MNAKACNSNCTLCENPYPYMCNECNGVIEDGMNNLPSHSELAAAIPAGVEFRTWEKGLSAIGTEPKHSVGQAAKNPDIVRKWIGSASGDHPFDINASY